MFLQHITVKATATGIMKQSCVAGNKRRNIIVRFYVNIVAGVLSVVKHYMVAVTRDISPFVAVSSVLLLP